MRQFFSEIDSYLVALDFQSLLQSKDSNVNF